MECCEHSCCLYESCVQACPCVSLPARQWSHALCFTLLWASFIVCAISVSSAEVPWAVYDGVLTGTRPLAHVVCKYLCVSSKRVLLFKHASIWWVSVGLPFSTLPFALRLVLFSLFCLQLHGGAVCCFILCLVAEARCSRFIDARHAHANISLTDIEIYQ